jgi:type I restriction enzyme M protein
MVYQLADNGTMACVLPHGVLFRGSSEEVIRKYLINDLNYLDAVIGLPANIFYGTGIPTCILVLKKCREQDDNIVFIDASGDNHFIKVGKQNELRDEDVELIINTYRNRESIEKYSSVVTLTEIEENDFNLNIPRYVDTFEEEEDIDLEEVSGEIQLLEKDLTETNQTIQSFCKELNISTPF